MYFPARIRIGQVLVVNCRPPPFLGCFSTEVPGLAQVGFASAGRPAMGYNLGNLWSRERISTIVKVIGFPALCAQYAMV